MLQTNPLKTDGAHLPPAIQIHSDRQDGAAIGELIKLALVFVRRQYLVIIVSAALATAASLLYLRLVSPSYTAQVQVLFENPRAQFLQKQSFLSEPVVDNTQIETQLQIIKSQATAVAVINQLKLTDHPDFRASRPLQSWLPRWLRRFGADTSEDPQSAPSDQPSEATIASFLDRLSAGRVGYSRVIELNFTSSDPALAAEIANATAKAYINDQLAAKFEASRTATSWLQERLRNLGEEALTAERAVGAYKSQNNIVSPGGKPIDEQQITELNTRLVAARAQSSEAAAKLAGYEHVLNSDPTKLSSIGTLDAIGPDAMSSQIITSLRQQYLELARREAELSARVGRDHLAVVNVRNRMREFRNSMLEEVRRLAEVSRSEVQLAKQRQQEIEQQLSAAVSQSRLTNSAELTIRDLESRAKSLRGLYDTFLQQYMGSTQQETFPISETRIIFPASAAQTKSKPKAKVVLTFGLLGGLALGLLLGFVRDVMDRVFRTSSQLEAALELPCLSLVPILSLPRQQRPAARLQQPQEDSNQRILPTAPDIHRAVVGMPLSRYTEAIRAIKIAIDHSPAKTPNQVIGVTSALPNEGKTTISASVAQLIGHSGKKVIIVDCDLRNPSLSARLVPKAVDGIIEVMNGDRSLEDVVWRDPRTALAVLPAVQRGPVLHSSELLSDGAICKLFDRLRQSYDYVIVDLPPLSPLVDVRVTAPLIDCYVLVVEWGRTKIDVVQHALHTAPTISDSLIGAVLNKTDIKAMNRYDAHRSDYYDDSHYVRYGLSSS
ncbi:AAA family ATPase [Bradyrhizobium vignae]|uniref:AAA family ATPase n=1 Tax=Bradyrhizobium vignae TaxID=1549949 RepID=UPI00100ABD15|nr:AAA family ATPase [Bradyrhizobium vignae]RXG91450.1 protein tyrosine kinase [Bradyrhizobium vignae]